MKQKVVMEKVEKGFKWRRGESKDEGRDTSPHVPYLTLIGQRERNQGSRQSVDRGLLGLSVMWSDSCLKLRLRVSGSYF